MKAIDKKAISLFVRQGERISLLTIEDRAWVYYTGELIEKYIGKSSSLYTNFIEWSQTLSINTNEAYYKRKEFGARRLIDTCIEYIENHGVTRLYRLSFIYTLSDGGFITILIGVLSATWIGGYVSGSYFAENKITEERITLKKEVIRLRSDSLRLSNSLSNYVANKKANIKKK